MKKLILIGWLLLLVCTQMQAAEKIKVACVGNSITYGYTLANRERDAYPFQLQRLLGDQYVVGNFGKSGATLLERGHRPYVKQDEYQQALQFAADIVVIHLGINDTDPRNWPDFRDDFVGDYLRLIASFRQVNPRCRIIVAHLSPIADRHPRFISASVSGMRKYRGRLMLWRSLAGQR